jgi:amino acid adenylation domain-containing protein
MTSTESDSLSPAHFKGRSLVELLGWRAKRQPSQIAYTFLKDGEADEFTLTYSELDSEARRIAGLLASRADKGATALLCFGPGLEFVAAFFGCLYAELIAAPAYPPDPARLERSLPRLAAIMADVTPSIGLTATAILPLVERMELACPRSGGFSWLGTDSRDRQPPVPGQRLLGEATEWKPADAEGSASPVAFLQYTSGSTTAPRGVMLTHSNLLHNAEEVYRKVEHRPEDFYVSWLPTFHDMGFMAGVLQPLYAGIPAVLMSPVSFLQRPLRWLQAISRYGATISGAPNFAYDLCVRKVNEAEKDNLDLSNWTVAFNGAEPVRPQTMDRFTAAFDRCGFRREAFYPCYGLAEATLMVSGGRKSAKPVTERVLASDLELGRVTNTSPANASGEVGACREIVGCGTAVGGMHIRIVDPESLIEIGPGRVGEIWVAGTSVGQGYWNRPVETSAVFGTRLPGEGSQAYLRTGDLGFMKDGELFVTGRRSDLIIIRGLNHYPQDIELTVQGCDPVLRPGCGAAFSIDNEGQETLVVVHEVERSQPSVLESALSKIRHAIAQGHELEVGAIALIKAATIPKTSSGKIQRNACRTAYLGRRLESVAEWKKAPAPQETPLAMTPPPVIHNPDDIGEWLTSRISARLNVDPTEAGLDCLVTEFGLDSLGAIELSHEVQLALNVNLAPSLFLSPMTVTQIAAEAFRRSQQEERNRRITGKVNEDRSLIRNDEYPLSHNQEALWLTCRLGQIGAAYNIVRAVAIQGDLDAERLRQAFQRIVDRHASLRTVYSDRQGTPLQKVEDRHQVWFEQQDARLWSEDRLRRQLSDEAEQPFNLSAPPLLRVTLLEGSRWGHVLVVAVHHIVADFWSLELILNELGVFYGARAGAEEALPEPKLEYLDYVRWQRALLDGPGGEQHWEFWRDRLSGDLPALDLPTDHSRKPLQTFNGSSEDFRLDRALTDSLKSVGRRRGATLMMALLAGFETLLHRYTGQERIAVGYPAAGRTSAEFANTVGYFVNAIVLMGDFSARPTFEMLLDRTRQDVLQASQHQDYPFGLIVNRLRPLRAPGQSLIFQAMMTFYQSRLPGRRGLGRLALGQGDGQAELGGLQLKSLDLKQKGAQFDIALTLAEGEEGLDGSLTYNSDLFDRTTACRLLNHLRIVLDQISQNPATLISSLTLMTAAEAHQLALEFNDRADEELPDGFIHQLVEARVDRTPEAVALVWADSHLTYDELNRRANQLANRLRSLGIVSESRVGILLDRTPDLVIAILGVLKAGGAYVPLDPGYPRERLSFMLDDAKATVLLIGGAAAGAAQFASVFPLEIGAQRLEAESVENLATNVASGNAAYVIYTSGSTGRPKGVVIEHNSSSALLRWAQQTFLASETEGVLAATSICFDLSVFEIFLPLTVGGKLILVDSALQLPYTPAAADVTLVNTVPAVMAELARAGTIPQFARLVNLAGERLGRDLVHRLYEVPGIRRVVNLYGPTEATTYSTYALLEADLCREPPIGRPVTGARAYVLDDHGANVPIGVTGELYLAGRGLARGYTDRPGETGEKFLPDPFADGHRMYKTGDLVRLNRSGELEYVGRTDDQIKLRGYRVELGEVEQLLMEDQAVESAAVVQHSRGSVERLIAFVVPRGEDCQAPRLTRYLSQRLPGYMLPSSIVKLDRMPLTSTGKIDRRSLASFQLAADSADSASGPMTPVEAVVEVLWSEVIGLERVGREDNFFASGGHSLLATRIVGQLQDLFGFEIALTALFENPTIAGIAQAIEATSRSAGVDVTRMAETFLESSKEVRAERPSCSLRG